MTQTYQTWFKTVLAANLAVADTTATLATPPTVTKGRMLLKNGNIQEWISFTWVSGSTITGLTRNLSQTADPATGGTGLSWWAGTQIILVAMHDQLPDKLENTAFTGSVTATDISFTGTTTGGLKVKSLTTAQRLAITPANGQIVYDSTLGENYQYIAGAWSAISAGSTQPNASTTVAGKVEIATTAESISGTDTGGTGALLSVLPSDIAANIQSGTFEYWVDVGWDDTYVVALTPVLTAYTVGQELKAKMTTANTGACTIDFWPGAKSIKMIDWTDPLDGAIGAGKVHTYVYDGTNLIITNPVVSLTSTLKAMTLWETMTAGDVVYEKNNSIYTFDGYMTLAWTAASLANSCSSFYVDTNTIVTIHYTSSLVKIVAGTVSGDTITYWTAVSTGINTTAFTGIKTDTNTWVILLQWGGGYGAIAFTVSGTTVTLWSNTWLGATATTATMCLLDTNKVAFVYGGATSYVNVRVATISGTTITMGTELVNTMSSYACVFTSICALSTTKFLVHANASGWDSARVWVYSVTWTTVVVWTVINIATTSNTPVDCIQVSTDLAIIMNDDTDIKMRYITVSWTVPTAQTAYTIVSAVDLWAIDWRYMCPYNSSFIVFWWINTVLTNAYYIYKNDTTYQIALKESVNMWVTVLGGTRISQITYKWVSDLVITDNLGNVYFGGNRAAQIVWILQSSGTVWQSKLVALNGGVSSVHSSLLSGEQYYAASSGWITTNPLLWSTSVTYPSTKSVGRAISATELIVNIV